MSMEDAIHQGDQRQWKFKVTGEVTEYLPGQELPACGRVMEVIRDFNEGIGRYGGG